MCYASLGGNIAGKWRKFGPERLAAAWKSFQRIISLTISKKLFTKIDEHRPLDLREDRKEAEKNRVGRVRRDKIDDSSTRQFLTPYWCCHFSGHRQHHT